MGEWMDGGMGGGGMMEWPSTGSLPAFISLAKDLATEPSMATHGPGWHAEEGHPQPATRPAWGSHPPWCCRPRPCPGCLHTHRDCADICTCLARDGAQCCHTLCNCWDSFLQSPYLGTQS